jgi:hypothetical protein
VLTHAVKSPCEGKFEKNEKLLRSELVEFSSLSNPLDLCSDHFLGIGINKPKVWLDGAILPPKFVFKNNKSLTNSKSRPDGKPSNEIALPCSLTPVCREY